MAEVILEHISKTYSDEKMKRPGSKAIDDISFTVHDKEFMVIVGPSGCGKSTLLRMIAGLEEISDGTLSINDKKINDLSPRDRDISMVFQNYALYPHMTVYDNLAFGLRLRHFSKSEIKKQVIQTAQLLEIEEELYRKPKTLSGGQRQRVAIGRAIIRRPKVFLFDEPLSNLDAKLRSQMRIELQKLHREIKATMIYVTHDQTEAMTLGNRIAVLNKGKLMQLDTPLHLYNSPANKFVAGFIGSPTMNFLNGTIQNKNGYYFVHEANLCSFNLGREIPISLKSYLGKKLMIGVRPEHIFINEEEDITKAYDCKLEIVAFENMGNEQFVYLSAGTQNLIVRRLPLEITEVGKRKSISCASEKIIYFNEINGMVINVKDETLGLLESGYQGING
ncbi:MAG TPA: sn-glycerol-3-phosphate ABC transporter ATP-binding protein UgpC [Puia sp.]|jgi:multiple sugar transport system ATP-binding protein|nr:sn-glycerol-3-phosphate ABC transporter ATP-binding protein UgpC [Puia sp.]